MWGTLLVLRPWSNFLFCLGKVNILGKGRRAHRDAQRASTIHAEELVIVTDWPAQWAVYVLGVPVPAVVHSMGRRTERRARRREPREHGLERSHRGRDGGTRHHRIPSRAQVMVCREGEVRDRLGGQMRLIGLQEPVLPRSSVDSKRNRPVPGAERTTPADARTSE